MSKAKIAISLDSALLRSIDSKVDHSVIRSRSQAIEYFLRKGLSGESINAAVLLLKGEHQHLALKKIHGTSLLRQQAAFFLKNGIINLYIVTQHTKSINLLLEEASMSSASVSIIQTDTRGNADALKAIHDKIKNSFIVMSGDTYNNFDLLKMIKKHADSDKIATMGLMTREKATSYGNAILDGDLVVDFQEKPGHHLTNIVNAGIYIFKPEIFEMLRGCVSLEKDLFPKLARIKQLVGFFTYGEYIHAED